MQTYKPKLLKVLKVPEDEKALRRVSKPLSKEEILSEDFQHFLLDLEFSLKNYENEAGWITVGMAAPQLDNPVQVFLQYDNEKDEMHEFINPKIEFLGLVQDVRIEACLSVPKTTGEVARFRRIRITYLDRKGQEHRDKYDGFEARVIQHEYDHLLGILFTDKLVK